ncbi:MAG TPA: gluconokinase [Burkholderiaceae bacterium]|nr:gluconokinase [Burkholderiaceae bacterium]
MGVSGSGKSAVGEALARALQWQFFDADDFHPPHNVRKMAAGIPLDDADRAPWLERLNAVLRHAVARGGCAVLACSALRQRYRDALRDRVPNLAFVHLAGEFALIEKRLAQRQHRYMPSSLLRSQFEALEPPLDAAVVDIAAPPDQIVAALIARLHASG